MKRFFSTGVLLLSVALFVGGVRAEIFSAGGFDFSDELGGFRLISVSGTGSVGDPIVLVEEITEVGPAVLVVRGTQMLRRKGKPDVPASFLNLAVIKIVINGSKRVWTGFDLELQEDFRKPSPYEDGLSFDQMGSFAGEPFKSDRFLYTDRVSEPYDRVRFHRGSVNPEAAIRIRFYITDPTPASEFYLLQEPRLLVADNDDDDRAYTLKAVSSEPWRNCSNC